MGETPMPDSPLAVLRPLGLLLAFCACTADGQTYPARPLRLLVAYPPGGATDITARVMANRVWQYHFGAGLVSTPNDFGRMGTRPSNPELLDWLAQELIGNGWKLKPLHRLMATSQTYRRSSRGVSETGHARDPDNIFLWRMNPRRMEAEGFRDSSLSTSCSRWIAGCDRALHLAL
jgi:hypothetical protein